MSRPDEADLSETEDIVMKTPESEEVQCQLSADCLTFSAPCDESSA